MASKKDKWISAKAEELYLKTNTFPNKIIEEAIRLGLDNADNEELKENNYSIVERDFDYKILINKKRFLAKIGYGSLTGITKEQAYRAAQAAIDSLKEG